MRLSGALASQADPAGELARAQELLALDPANIKARTLRAKLLFKAGRLDEAARELEAVLTENQTDNSARYGLAVIYEKKGDLPAARAEWGTFLQFEPGNTAVAGRLSALEATP